MRKALKRGRNLLGFQTGFTGLTAFFLLQGKFFGTSDVDLENRFITLRNPDALFGPASGRDK